MGHLIALMRAGYLKGVITVALVQVPGEEVRVDVQNTGLGTFDAAISLGAAYAAASEKLRLEQSSPEGAA